ncbi:MAG: imidazoleglycerol-phosphate dehydratase HisB [Ruminococcus sp.]|nr:imidazoleglycerol-phosphate dehydratase HisB [Ruminococcus sp.]
MNDILRKGSVTRTTRETDINISVILDGKGVADISTGIGFFDHMLTALSVHSGISMTVKVKGDLHVDCHHTIEDTGIALGQALGQALGSKSGIVRYGTAYIPMDESLAMASLDLSNRPFLVFNCDFTNQSCGEYDLCMTEEFFRAFAFNSGMTLHINLLYGTNDHHKAEAIYKAVAHALKTAVMKNSDGAVLSTKGVL